MLHTSVFTTVYFTLLAAILGACMGSFLNCMGWRIVHGESVVNGRSHCDSCGHVLTFTDLIPVFSYIAHKGRCRYCGVKLSASHLVGEIVSALVFVSCLWKFDISLDFAQDLLFGCILLAVSFADIEGFIIPDGFIIAAIVLRVIFVSFSKDILARLVFSALGGFGVALVLLLIVLLFEKLFHREAMGGGDIKLIFVCGLFLGWQKNILCLLLACVVGIIFGVITQNARKAQEDPKIFPFGPSIAIGAWLALLFGENIINAYISLF